MVPAGCSLSRIRTLTEAPQMFRRRNGWIDLGIRYVCSNSDHWGVQRLAAIQPRIDNISVEQLLMTNGLSPGAHKSLLRFINVSWGVLA